MGSSLHAQLWKSSERMIKGWRPIIKSAPFSLMRGRAFGN